MIEVSTLVLALLIEVIAILLAIIFIGLYLNLKRKKRDRLAAQQLAQQIKTQSDVRLKETGSYLAEKYHFEGNQLKKAVEAIDKSEKRFFQTVIALYLQRDADKLAVLDSSVAELIETYKRLKPANPVQEGTTNTGAELERLQQENVQLTEELEITNKTMSDMIHEFGNMFGGGSDSHLQKEEVFEKVISHQSAEVATIENEIEGKDEISIDSGEHEEEVNSESDIDDILNGINPPKD